MPPVTPVKATDFKISDVKVLKKILPYLMRMRTRVFLALGFLLVAKFANVGIPIALKNIVDNLDQTNVVLILPLGLLLAYGALRLSSSLFNELRDAVFAKVRYQTMRTIAVEIFQHLHKLDLSYHLNRKIGAISRDIDRGTNSISTLFSILVFNIFPSLFEIILVVGILLINFDSIIALTAFATVFLYIFITIHITKWRMKYRYEMNDIQSEASNTAIDSLINYETVKYFNKEHSEYTKYNHTMGKWQEVSIKSFTTMTALNFVQGAIIATGVTIILILAADEVVQGNITLGELIMIQALLLQLFLPLGNLGIVYRQIKHNFIDMNNMFDILDKTPQIVDIEDAHTLQVSRGDVEFQNVVFSYNPDNIENTIFTDLSFTASKGEKVAIVGASGSGKSSIVKLLFRFFDIQGGQILIDGQNIATVTQDSLRSHIGIVPQDNIMFNDSIFNNIAYGASREVTLNEVREVAKHAYIDDFVMSLPEQYNTIVGERGLKLSGGEKQRLAIARVLLKNPDILIFDEATSALDNVAENIVQQAINSFSKERTTIIIAHRLSTIKDADKIIVLDKGVLAESGTHEELLQNKSVYYTLNQQKESVDGVNKQG